MQSRAGNNSTIISAVGIAAVSVLLAVINADKGFGYLIGWTVPWIAVVAVFLFAASRALTLRQVITVRLRRSQALGIGLTAAGLAWFFSIFALPQLSSNAGLLPGSTVAAGIFLLIVLSPFVVFFYWVDASVLNAVRSDPLVRDILHWRAARRWVWGLLASLISILVLWGIVFVGILGPRSLDVIELTSIYAIAGIPLVTGLVLLPFAVRRSGDPTIRRHLRWFGYFVGFLGLGTVGFVASDFVGALRPVWQILWVVSGYYLYRSSGALVVVSQLPSDIGLAPPHMTAGEA